MASFAQEVASSMSRIRAGSPERCGTLVRLVGLRLEARGMMAPMGSSCEIMSPDGHRIEAEVVGLPPMPFLVFTDANPAIRETARHVFYSETTRRGLLFHPNHHWFVSHAHTEQDLAHTLEISEAAFRLVKKKLGHGYRAPSVSKVAVTVST